MAQLSTSPGSAACVYDVLLSPCHQTLIHASLAWYDAGEGCQAVATAVATGLVAAYADLRQLQFLLQSLLDALLAQTPPTAAAVLCVAPFVQALQKVRQTRALPGWCGAAVQIRLSCI